MKYGTVMNLEGILSEIAIKGDIIKYALYNLESPYLLSSLCICREEDIASQLGSFSRIQHIRFE